MEQNPKSIEAAVIAKDAVDEEPIVAPRSKKSKRAVGRAVRRVANIATKAMSQDKPMQDKPAQEKSAPQEAKPTKRKTQAEEKATNRVRATRIERMMSKAELARRAGISVLTIDRVEKGLGCRMDTKRKILEALGLSLADRVRVFGEEE
jgi:DNA-binding XRE family transcriptional regulator